MQQPALSSTRLAAFVSPEAPFAAFLIVLVVYVPPFYAGELGLGLSAVGLIFGLTKLWDLVTDPAFGVLSDRWHTRWGRRLPWLILSVPILVLSTYRVLMPEADVTGGDFAFWMVVIYIGWTFGTVSHIAWAAELSEDYHERSRISAYKQGAALIGSLGLLVAVAVAERFFGIDEVQRMQLIAYLLIVLLPVTVAAALWATPEPSSRAVPKRGTTPGILRRLLENPPLRRLLGANLLLGIAAGAQGGLFLFYAEDVLRLGNWSSFAIIPFMFSGLLFLPLFLFLSRRIEKHQTLCCALLYQIVAGLLFLVIPENSVVIASLALLLLGASGSVSTFIPRAMMADIGDMNTAQTGAAQTGLYMSLLQSTSKIAAAIAVGLSYPILSLIGFDPAPGALNTEAALQGLRVMMFALPAIAFGLVIALMWRFPLTEAAHAALQSTINRDRTSAVNTPQTPLTSEALTR